VWHSVKAFSNNLAGNFSKFEQLIPALHCQTTKPAQEIKADDALYESFEKCDHNGAIHVKLTKLS
jgi:hypothetical protein